MTEWSRFLSPLRDIVCLCMWFSYTTYAALKLRIHNFQHDKKDHQSSTAQGKLQFERKSGWEDLYSLSWGVLPSEKWELHHSNLCFASHLLLWLCPFFLPLIRTFVITLGLSQWSRIFLPWDPYLIIPAKSPLPREVTYPQAHGSGHGHLWRGHHSASIGLLFKNVSAIKDKEGLESIRG